MYQSQECFLATCGQQFELAIQVSSSRPLRLLISQLDKLYDVIQLVLKEKQAFRAESL